MKTHILRYTIVHVLSYLIVGVISMFFMNYKEVFLTDSYFSHFRPLDSIIVQSAVLFQIFRGSLIALVIFPFHKTITESKNGFIYLFGLLFGLTAILSLPAAPGTIEGFIYTDVSITAHLIGVPEIFIQSVLISYLYFTWYQKRPISSKSSS